MPRTEGEDRIRWMLSRLAARRVRWSVTVPLVLLLAGGSVVLLVGQSAGTAVLRLGNAGVWLASSAQGIVSHINGPSGRVDATTRVSNAKDPKLIIAQEGSSVLVTDTSTGIVSRIDPVTLIPAEQKNFRTGITVVTGDDQAYVVNDQTGRVTRIDPQTLDVLGSPVDLGAPIAGAGMADDGTLWVALPSGGKLVPIRHGAPGSAVTVSRPDDQVSLTIADGHPVVVNASDGTLVGVRDGHPTAPLRLPSQGRPLKVAPRVDGPLVPITVGGTDTLLLADWTAGTVDTVEIGSQHPSDNLGAPVTANNRVYIPDNGTGRLLVYATDAAAFVDPIKITSGEPAGELAVTVKDGTVWVNDPDGTEAAVIRPDGSVQKIEKLPVAPGPTNGPTTNPPQAPARPQTQAPPQTPAQSQAPPQTQTRPQTQTPPQTPAQTPAQAPAQSQAPPQTPARPQTQAPPQTPTRPQTQAPPQTPTRPQTQAPPQTPTTAPSPTPVPVPVPVPVTYTEVPSDSGSPTFATPHFVGANTPRIGAHVPVQVRCRTTGDPVANGNTWYYLVVSGAAAGRYAPADNFYNDGSSSGPPNTVLVDTNVPLC
ncbi:MULTISPECIES: hypothetical protein [unclassified Frankia]|uniref:hypothetical protein n=1 Tax=unclassified Frankia TaxID=2632575 RepID=UPI002AD4C24B|nr:MULTISPECIES: hypothetical protein [unclassified Frankia]